MFNSVNTIIINNIRRSHLYIAISYSGVSKHHAQPMLLDNVHCGDISFYSTDKHSIQLSDNRIKMNKHVLWIVNNQWGLMYWYVYFYKWKKNMNIVVNRYETLIETF